MSQLIGSQLLEVLQLTEAEVKVFAASGEMRRVSPAEALRLVACGDYTGSGSLRRVRAIREVPDTRTPNEADTHRWDDRAMFHYACSPSRATVDLWDRILSHA